MRTHMMNNEYSCQVSWKFLNQVTRYRVTPYTEEMLTENGQTDGGTVDAYKAGRTDGQPQNIMLSV